MDIEQRPAEPLLLPNFVNIKETNELLPCKFVFHELLWNNIVFTRFMDNKLVDSITRNRNVNVYGSVFISMIEEAIRLFKSDLMIDESASLIGEPSIFSTTGT
jgi:hypothetical protein